MGKLSMDKSKQEKQAGDVVNKMFAVLIGMSVPLQIYFNVPGKTLGLTPIFGSPKISSPKNTFLKVLSLTGFDPARSLSRGGPLPPTPKRYWKI